MAVSTKVTTEMFEEAVRLGTQSADSAIRYQQLSIDATSAIKQALEFLESGQTDKARERLRRALFQIGKKLEP